MYSDFVLLLLLLFSLCLLFVVCIDCSIRIAHLVSFERVVLPKFAKWEIVVPFELTVLCKITWSVQDILVKK